jgi:hypothetical protein
MTDQHWQLVQMAKEFQGYDREASEHELEIAGRPKKPDADSKSELRLSPAQARAMYLLKLEGSLSSPQQVHAAAGLKDWPEIIRGSGDDGELLFAALMEKQSFQSPSSSKHKSRILSQDLFPFESRPRRISLSILRAQLLD